MSAGSGPKYILDTNVFISATNYYSFENFPGVWDFLAEQLENRIIISHRKVLTELLVRDDALKKWAEKLSRECFPEATEEEFQIRQELLKWAQQGDYRPAAISRFRADSYADTWLCAKAKAMGLILVTQEVSAPFSKRDIKLPDACAHLNVACVNILDMIKDLSPVFVRESPQVE